MQVRYRAEGKWGYWSERALDQRHLFEGVDSRQCRLLYDTPPVETLAALQKRVADLENIIADYADRAREQS